ncbi:MAG: response regulator transcription factor [Brotaphodocola sp.]
MLKILIVEDEEPILKLYQIVLKKEGYATFLAHNGEEAWKIMETKHIDLVITDVMMPVMDGYEFVRTLREYNPQLPVLMITAKDDFASKSMGFSLGTDDYMTKPVDLDEMVLRVKALLRRANIATSRQLTLRSTLLDYDSLSITYRKESITIPPKEFFLLYKLLSYPNKIFTRRQLMEEIWGMDSQSDIQTIDVHINRIRRRFENNPDFEIQTIRGLGYKAVIRS